MKKTTLLLCWEIVVVVTISLSSDCSIYVLFTVDVCTQVKSKLSSVDFREKQNFLIWTNGITFSINIQSHLALYLVKRNKKKINVLCKMLREKP